MKWELYKGFSSQNSIEKKPNQIVFFNHEDSEKCLIRYWVERDLQSFFKRMHSYSYMSDNGDFQFGSIENISPVLWSYIPEPILIKSKDIIKEASNYILNDKKCVLAYNGKEWSSSNPIYFNNNLKNYKYYIELPEENLSLGVRNFLIEEGL